MVGFDSLPCTNHNRRPDLVTHRNSGQRTADFGMQTLTTTVLSPALTFTTVLGFLLSFSGAVLIVVADAFWAIVFYLVAVLVQLSPLVLINSNRLRRVIRIAV